MPVHSDQLTVALRIAIAALIGLLVGLEREWSGHATGALARFAGIRTFMLLGITGGVAGSLVWESHELMGAVIALGAFALTVTAYANAVRGRTEDFDGTTEAAAIVVVALGVASGIGWMSLAAGTGSIVVLALREKARLHALVKRVGETELRAALQFAALALVVLPLLPRGPLFGSLAIEPRSLWTVVLVFLAINYAGYLIRRALGPGLGYGIAGAVGGIISSTAVTLTFARQSRIERSVALPLARGIIAASAVVPVRILIVALVLNSAVALALLPVLAPVILVAGIIAWRIDGQQQDVTPPESLRPMSPLGLATALQMVVAFQVAIIALRYAGTWWGESGAYASAALLGLASMDALAFSTIRSDVAADPGVAAAVIAVGLIANMLMRAAIASVLGAAGVRRVAGATLLLLAAIGGAALLVL